MERICDVWPVQPSKKHLNIFVSPQKRECIICLFALAQTLSATPLASEPVLRASRPPPHIYVSTIHTCILFAHIGISGCMFAKRNGIRSWQAISCCRRLDVLRPPMVSGGSLENLESKRP